MATANIDIKLSNGNQAGKTITEMRQQANRLNKEINGLTIGSDKYVKKTAEFNKVTSRLKEVREEAKGVKESTESAGESFAQFLPFGAQIQQVTGTVKGLAVGMKGLRAAIISTGIGALVIVVISLVSWFQRTEKGAQTLRVIMAGLGQVTDSLMDVLVALGEAIFNAFNNPKQALKDFGDSFNEFIMDRFALFTSGLGKLGTAVKQLFAGEFSAAIDSAKEGIVDFNRGINPSVIAVELLSKGVTKTIQAAKDLAKELQGDAAAAMALARDENELRIKNRNFLIEEAKLRTQVAKLREFATDVTRSDLERQQALQKAGELLNEVETKKIALKSEQLRILQAQQEISITDEAGFEEAARLEAELINLQEAKASSMRRITAQESALRLRMNTERQKEIDSRVNAEIKAEENIQNIKLQLMEEGLQKEIEKIALDTERKIEALVGSEELITEQAVLLEELKQQKIQAVKDKSAAAQLKEDEANAKKANDLEQQKADFKNKIAKIETDIAKDVTGFLGDQLTTQIEDEKAAKEIKKGAKLIDIGINLQGELSANALAAAQNPANGATVGIAGITQLAASNIASIVRAGISTATVLSFEKGGYVSNKNAMKYALGGYLNGPRHTQGGIPIEAEGGEFIFKRSAVQGIGVDTLNDWNNRFESGGPVNPLRTNANIDRSSTTTTTPTSTSNDMSMALVNEFRSFKNEITAWQRNLKVNNNLQDTNSGLGVLNRLEDDASV